MIKKCKNINCNKEFETKYRRDIYCSAICEFDYMKFLNIKIIKKCDNINCKRGIDNKRRLIYREKQKYCSPSCSSKVTLVGRKIIITDEHRKNLSNARKGRSYEDLYGKEKAKEIKEQRSKVFKELRNDKNNKFNTKRKEGLKPREFSDIHRENLRKSAINRILENGVFYSIGLNEDKLLNEQEIKDNCKIERQYNTEIGYIVDGYCKETNTVYEVYEKVHDKYVFEDLERENRICKKLNCNFVIIYDRTH